MWSRWVAYCVTLSVLAVTVIGRDYTQRFVYEDLNCTSTESHYITNDQSYAVQWHGCKKPECKLVFIPRNTDGTVCIDSVYYYVSDCSTQVEIYTGNGGVEILQKVYKCFNQNLERACGEHGENVSISVKYLTQDVSDHPGMFELKVFIAQPLNVGILVAVIVCPIILTVLIVTLSIGCCIYRARKRHAALHSLLHQKDQHLASYPRNPTFSSYQSTGGSTVYGSGRPPAYEAVPS